MRMTTEARSDHDIQVAVRLEVEWIPEVNASGIGTAVRDGVVTLSGEVRTIAERRAVTRGAMRVRGVSAVVDDITIHSDSEHSITEVEIAQEVAHALKSANNIPDTIKAEVSEHHVTLSGQALWDFQRYAAVQAVRNLRGVYGVDSTIVLTPRPSATDTEERITKALTRNAALDAGHITVTVVGTKAILCGRVRSWSEKEQAGRAAWMSPNVTEVNNEILVRGF